jgi:hypothetical protein
MNILVDEEIVIKLLSFIDITLETLHDKNASEIEELYARDLNKTSKDFSLIISSN